MPIFAKDSKPWYCADAPIADTSKLLLVGPPSRNVPLALNAAFESLPGIAFTVNGTPIPHDSALTGASAQLFFAPNWSLLVRFDGEFASGAQVYAGSGTLRYTW